MKCDTRVIFFITLNYHMRLLVTVLLGLQLVLSWYPGAPPQCTYATEAACDLRELWLKYNEAHVLHRIIDHADHYQQHLPARFGEGKVKMLEIGIQSGGSARAWKQWYKDRLTYVGIDVEPKCKRTENATEDIWVELGSQLNVTFLMEVCRKHGPFDVCTGNFTSNHTCRLHKLLALCFASSSVRTEGFRRSLKYQMFESPPSADRHRRWGSSSGNDHRIFGCHLPEQ